MWGAGMLGGTPTYQITIAASGGAWKRTVDAPQINASVPCILYLTIAAGVERQATSTAAAAIDFDGIAPGSIVTLTNLGYALGKGGAGATGGGPTAASPAAGSNAGHAIKGPGAGVEFRIINASGRIWGGGGGGGGGGASTSGGIANSQGGGGGGGGVGGGAAGAGGNGNSSNGSAGTAATTGSAATPGSGGAGSGTAGNGGAGGNWGTDGSDGLAGGSSGGTAGKAIDLNGGSATFLSGSGSPNVKGAVA